MGDNHSGFNDLDFGDIWQSFFGIFGLIVSKGSDNYDCKIGDIIQLTLGSDVLVVDISEFPVLGIKILFVKYIRSWYIINYLNGMSGVNGNMSVL